MVYIAEKLGYAPMTPVERARAEMIMLNCMDYITEGRRSFHPIHYILSYREQQEEGDRASKIFSKERMRKYLHHFNKVIRWNGPDPKPVAGGSNITYADFALFHVLDATIHQFNTQFYGFAWDNTNVPALKTWYDWFLSSRPNIKAYRSSARAPPFAGDSMM
jgi:glutathione S-transferase